MKALTLVTLLMMATTSLHAAEIRPYNDERADIPVTNPFLKSRTIASAPEMKVTIQSHVRIAQLERELEMQKHNYEKRIEYLQAELKKSQKTLVDRSLNQIKKEKMLTNNHLEEQSMIMNKLSVSNQKILEYQKLMTATKPSDEMKMLIESNTQLAAELRKATDQLAHPGLKKIGAKEAVATKETINFGGRFPASE